MKPLFQTALYQRRDGLSARERKVLCGAVILLVQRFRRVGKHDPVRGNTWDPLGGPIEIPATVVKWGHLGALTMRIELDQDTVGERLLEWPVLARVPGHAHKAEVTSFVLVVDRGVGDRTRAAALLRDLQDQVTADCMSGDTPDPEEGNRESI